ncbi:MAG TPA: ABC transporter permease [Bryobacteraceae bacterium]|jgi:predicted permease|nr:ABC transporter permease [Bryobacteraceae bacterium]
MASFLQDLRFALRSLRKSPGFTAIAALTLALGIGANAALFTVVNAVLLRPLPYRDPARIVNIWNDYGDQGQSLPAVSPPDFLDYRERARLFEGFAAAQGFTTSLTGDGEPEQVRAAAVTANFFPLLGVPVERGRHFQAGEDVPNGPAVMVLSYRLWQRRYGADPNILGHVVRMQGAPFTVVGVMPERFELLLPAEAFQIDDADLWVTQRGDPRQVPRNLTTLSVIARIKPGVTIAQAQQEMDGIAAQLRSEHLVHRTSGLRIRAVPYQHDVVKGAEPAMLALFGAVGLLLLIACANVANLLLARSEGMSRETSIRVALGATFGRLVRQSLTQSLLLALLGGVGGILLAEGSLDLLRLLRPAGLPRLHEIQLDLASFLFTLGACVLTALLFGLLPALQGSREGTGERLKSVRLSGTLDRRRSQNLLIAGEIGLSVVLLVAAGLLYRSFAALGQVSPGFRAESALTFEVSPTNQRFPNSAGAVRFFETFEQQLATLPGVEKVGSISKLPLTGSGAQTPYAWDADTAAKWESISADWRWVTPGWLDAIGGRLAAGRWFTPQDDPAHPPVIVVDEVLARRAFPGRSAVGLRLLTMAIGQYPRDSDGRMWAEIVGVVAHIRSHDLRRDVREQVYMPAAQIGNRRMAIVVRTSVAPERLTAPVQQVLRSIDPDVPLAKVSTLESLLGSARAQARFTLLVASLFGMLAVVLVVVGLYGVVSYAAAQRRQEMGIRMALGAQPAQIRWMVLERGLRLGAWGLLAGLAAAMIVTRLGAGFLYGVQSTDPPTYLAVALLVLGVSLAAAYVPARRAMREDPVSALRND